MKQLLITAITLIGLFFPKSLSAEETILLQQLREARKNIPVTVEIHEERNSKGEFTHMGVALFSKEHQQVLNPHLWRGSERMLLELLLKQNDAERIQWLKERNVRLFLGATPFGSQGFTSFSKAIPVLKYVHSIKINEEADRYKLLVTGGSDDQTLRLSFPKERELIFGTDKKEEDARQGEMFKNFKGAPLSIFLPDIDELVPSTTPDIYHTMGQALYIDSLRTDTYYGLGANKEVMPVYCSSYPKESVRNLLLGKVRRKELKVHVSHRQYGNAVLEWTMNWDNLLAALCSEEVMEPFAAVQYSAERRQLTGILILRNIAFGYNNMLLLSIPLDQLDTDQPATLEGLLYTNIPQHNILSLFEERVHKNNSSTKPQQIFNHPIN